MRRVKKAQPEKRRPRKTVSKSTSKKPANTTTTKSIIRVVVKHTTTTTVTTTTTTTDSAPEMLAARVMVQRENHPINQGRSRLVGKRGKLYHRGDIVGPIIDSMHLMYSRLGWTARFERLELDERFSDHNFAITKAGAPGPPGAPSARMCLGCSKATNINDFISTRDKSHLVCRHCGAVSAPLRISTDREKNCTRDEDKTTHADRPFDQNGDRFSKPGMLASERRRQTEREVAGTRISNKTKEKHGIGFAQEHANRQAAKEEIERQRADMSARDYNKGSQIIVELEKLFVPLEQINDEVKRHCRKEADRLWREAVRHTAVCCADARCQLRLKDRPVSVISQVSLACTLHNLAQGIGKLDRVPHGHIVALNTKLRTTLPSAISCGYRAVEQVVRRLMANDGFDPIHACPIATPSPSPSVASTISSRCGKPPPVAFPPGGGGGGGNASPVAVAVVPLIASESSSDLEETAELLQLRNSIGKVFRHVSCAQRVNRAALCAIQDTVFRSALLNEQIGSTELAYSILDAVNQTLTGVGLQIPARLGKLKIDRVAPLTQRLLKLLPASVISGEADEEDEDELF
jgi:hypothetical protein